jgi:hypothetical protein
VFASGSFFQRLLQKGTPKMPLKAIGNVKPAEILASFDSWTRIHLQVRDGNSIFIGRTRSDLETPGPGGLQQGLLLTQASGIVSLPWIGTLYAFGSAQNSLLDFEIFPEGVNIGR